MLSSRGHWAVSGDICGHHDWGWLLASRAWDQGGCSPPHIIQDGLASENDLACRSTVLRGETLLYKIRPLKKLRTLQYHIQNNDS